MESQKRVKIMEIRGFDKCMITRTNCYFCGFPVTVVHHIIARSQGGLDNKQNRINICPNCHLLIHKGILYMVWNTETRRFMLESHLDPTYKVYPSNPDNRKFPLISEMQQPKKKVLKGVTK